MPTLKPLLPFRPGYHHIAIIAGATEQEPLLTNRER